LLHISGHRPVLDCLDLLLISSDTILTHCMRYE
jgi:hypothetical protein